MTDLDSLFDKPIFDEFPQWTIEPLRLGWSASRTVGGNTIVVTKPTIHDLRLKLREVTSRAVRG